MQCMTELNLRHGPAGSCRSTISRLTCFDVCDNLRWSRKYDTFFWKGLPAQGFATPLAEADEALRKLPRIRPPTRDAAGSEQLPIAAAIPPALPLSDTLVRRLLGERGVAIQRHLDTQTPAGSYGSIFSESLRSIRQRGTHTLQITT